MQNGTRFGRLEVLETLSGFAPGQQRARVRCDCGTEKLVRCAALYSGRTKSCGCLRREMGIARGKASRRHGEGSNGKETPEYRAWSNMLSRCENPNHQMFANYGALGIRVCKRWHVYEAFLADVGRRPSDEHSLDRFPNPHGDYKPSNVRWATSTEQNRNRRNTPMATLNGKTLSTTDWCEVLGLNPFTIRTRIQRGMSPEQALSLPVRAWNRRSNAHG